MLRCYPLGVGSLTLMAPAAHARAHTHPPRMCTRPGAGTVVLLVRFPWQAARLFRECDIVTDPVKYYQAPEDMVRPLGAGVASTPAPPPAPDFNRARGRRGCRAEGEDTGSRADCGGYEGEQDDKAHSIDNAWASRPLSYRSRCTIEDACSGPSRLPRPRPTCIMYGRFSLLSAPPTFWVAHLAASILQIRARPCQHVRGTMISGCAHRCW